jgi:uncharacterized lipoprotein
MEQLSQIQQINSSIMFGDFTNDQLDSIIAAIKFARNNLARQAKNSFSKGSKVKFRSSRNGQTIVGTVEKVNRKFIIVREQTSSVFGVNWRVPANMLESAEI